MTLKNLLKIKTELIRVQSAVEEAIEVAKNDKSEYRSALHGTSLSGAVKRKYLDMKYEINKILK